MDIETMETKMESVKEIWNKNGSFVSTQKTSYERLDTAGGNLDLYEEFAVKSMLNQFLYSSIDAWLESMPKEVKKGIMKMDWEKWDIGSYGQFGFVGQFLSDTYDSDGELNFGSTSNDFFAHKTFLKIETELEPNES